MFLDKVFFHLPKLHSPMMNEVTSLGIKLDLKSYLLHLQDLFCYQSTYGIKSRR